MSVRCHRRLLGLIGALLLFAMHLAQHLVAQVSPSAVLAPTALAYDAAGNLYFTDVARHQVFEATLGGQLLLIAGSGTQGYAGDNSAATAAHLNQPQGLAIAANGTLYIADTGNHVIRTVVGGVITTIAGTGAQGYSGDNGPALAAQLASPNALALDSSGALLLCDSGNHRIRRIANGVIATVAGSGTQGFTGDGGPAMAAQLDTPSGIAIDATGRIFISDTHNQRVRLVGTGGIITTCAGTAGAGFSGDGGPAVAAQLDTPRGLAIVNGALLIADSGNQRIRSVSPQGIVTTLAGSVAQGNTADGTLALTAALNTPRNLGVSAFAQPTFSDAPNRTLHVLVADGALYVPAAFAPLRASIVTVTATVSAVIAVSGSVGTPQGTVQLLIDATPAASAMLTNGTATIPLALAAGSHTLSATYAGDGLNPASTSAAITVSAGKAASAVIAQPPAPNDYAGLPLLLNADVTSTSATTSLTPTGTVNFLEGTTTVATAQLAAGIATGVYLAPTAGTHTIVASYMGDANFMPSAAPAVTAIVKPTPDFVLTAAGSATQTVVAGAIATYALTLTPQNGPFTGAISLSVSGLPFGATASFTPPQLVPGTSSANATLNIQTLAKQAQLHARLPVFFAVLVLPLLWRRRLRHVSLVATFTLCLLFTAGCGTRVNQPPTPSAGTYTLIVSATGTNLAGATVIHTTLVTLIIE